MHTDLTWQRTIDRQTHLRREARRWRLRVRVPRTDHDPSARIRSVR
jgi:hypothetical protein